MADQTRISWADATHNEWIGCDKVAPECRVCYAETMNRHRGWMGEIVGPNLEFKAAWRSGVPRYLTSAQNRNAPFRWDRKAKALGIKRRVFTSSLSDWLDEEVPVEWLASLLSTVTRTPNLIWLMLSKRNENFASRLIDAIDYLKSQEPASRDVQNMIERWLDCRPPENVHLGMTAGSKQTAKEIPLFAKMPANKRFLSVEPLLEDNAPERLDGIHQVIIGGENDSSAKPMHPAWVRNWLELARRYNAARWFKQHGTWIEEKQAELSGVRIPKRCDFGMFDLNGEYTPGARPIVRSVADAGPVVVFKLGVEAAGHLFDGQVIQEKI